MASSIALKRASATANLLRSVRRPLSGRLFNTNAQLRHYDEGSDRDGTEIDHPRRGGYAPSLISGSSGTHYSIWNFRFDVFDPFNSTRSLLNMVDQLMEMSNPNSSSGRVIGGVMRRGWDAREDDKGLYLRVDMPGLGKENVKVSVEENTLTIRGEGEKESEEDQESGIRRYSSRINLPPKLFKLDQIKAEIKNGVLKVVVPKAKEEERKDVLHVNVE
ncbi:hypothetical protein Sjap_004297 [Stephania japonica]|uniref:SHSP domain-containing protein n=1 Tax=Stephania japonica TaxID=461633 RepID=A0AAP0K2Z4_9MAGN